MEHVPCGGSVTGFHLLADYTITGKLIIFAFIVDLQNSHIARNLLNLPQNNFSIQSACIFRQCIVVFAPWVLIMGFGTKSNS